ncbi:helicase POLQ-like isoform X2 [Syngnathoides biaculeatus]|uniref:helicase POLQ-like isoform X2 n=1 Tax=Syngnathoides biaculeatus TaxID=300417 RepID=UPI002ADDD70D|nr:helicase POLQ-like isoform X2 [Syngnathoides biaculeatus]
MDDKQHVECSDSDDLFGDYDGLLEDESFSAELDRASEPAAEVRHFLSEPVADAARDDVPCGQREAKRRKVHGHAAPGTDDGKPRGVARRSVSERVKKTLRGNAASPAGLSRSVAMKEAALSREVSGAAEAVRAHRRDLGPFFGLPGKVRDLLFTLRGIRSLYAWQETCLRLDSVSERRNLIYTLPTGGGKTLVAEVLMIRELLCGQRDCIFVLPYVALVQEKVRGLAVLGLELDFLVEEYAGSKGRFPPVSRRGRRSLYVATIEKAHALVNALIESDALRGVGLLVVDELHMLGSGSRGALLEITLAKVLHLSRDTQIVGMSATLGNIGELRTFLKADNYRDDFRPVDLKEYVKLGDGIYEADGEEEDGFRLCRRLKLNYSSAMQKADPDHIVALVTEVIPEHSCLLFCPTKKNCENVAAMICKYLRRDFLARRQTEKEALLRRLRDCGAGRLCPLLSRTVPLGVAYHHSGLTADERRLLEDAYAAGVLCLLACTSTLAAGVNLPARRVIVRSPLVARAALTTGQYKQMAGRAGRAGLDTRGESILVLQEAQRDKVASCVDHLEEFLRGTLLFVQRERQRVRLEDVVPSCVDLLKVKGLLHAEGRNLQVTQLGRATFKGCVDVIHSEVLYQDLQQGLEGLLLDSYLHLLFLVTPYDLAAACTPDWMTFYTQMSSLSASELKMCAAVGVPESLVARMAAGQSVSKSANMCVAKRAYLALVLMLLLKDGDIWGVAQKFQLTRGFVQSLLSSAAAFCTCVLHFTQELERLWPYRSLLEALTRRLSYCVKTELIPLMEVAGVTEARAKQLHAAGYTTPTHLASADVALLVRTVEHLSRKRANQMVATAKMLLDEKAAALQQEVDRLLAVPPRPPDLTRPSQVT